VSSVDLPVRTRDDVAAEHVRDERRHAQAPGWQRGFLARRRRIRREEIADGQRREPLDGTAASVTPTAERPPHLAVDPVHVHRDPLIRVLCTTAIGSARALA
jgi:hypothetical protein